MAELIFLIIAIYLGIGVLFAFLFLSIGLSQVDKDAKGSGASFRLIILPGTIVLWPIFLFKWLKKKS